jgi:tripartite-type tricarboxylate transporter receptor subunit TctC
MQDLVGGQIDLRFAAEGSQSLPYLRDGQIKALAVLAPARWAPTPDVPTIDEAGVPGLHLSLWNGIWAPKGTPHDVIMKLNGVIRSALADAAVKQRLLELGQVIPSSEQQTPQALAAYHKSEIEKWWPIIKAANRLSNGYCGGLHSARPGGPLAVDRLPSHESEGWSKG